MTDRLSTHILGSTPQYELIHKTCFKRAFYLDDKPEKDEAIDPAKAWYWDGCSVGPDPKYGEPVRCGSCGGPVRLSELSPSWVFKVGEGLGA